MKEEEIRPKAVFDEYLRLCEEDTRTYFSEALLEEVLCPACGREGEFAFTKHGFDYESCPECQTLFVNPRPVAEAFDKYYTESPSSRFWADTFYPATQDARREKLWKPKCRMIRDALARYHASDHEIIDVGGGYGLFAEEMRELVGRPVTVIEPGPHLANVCRGKALPVVEKFLEGVEADDLPTGPKAFVSFELFEHLHSPSTFLGHLKGLINSGDLFMFTTLSSTGVDIQALWEDSKSVSPPHHLNFLNPRSAKLVIDRVGLEVLEVSTPGKLDIDILVNNQDRIKDRFWRTFVASATEGEKEAWQALIAASGWSSHMMVTCRRR